MFYWSFKKFTSPFMKNSNSFWLLFRPLPKKWLAIPDASFRMKSISSKSVDLQIIPIDHSYEWMGNLFPTHGLIRRMKVWMTPTDNDLFFFNPNWCLKFIPNDSAPIGTKFSFRLNPVNGSKPFRMIPCHSPFKKSCKNVKVMLTWRKSCFEKKTFKVWNAKLEWSFSHRVKASIKYVQRIVKICMQRATQFFCVEADIIDYNVRYWCMIKICHTYMQF